MNLDIWSIIVPILLSAIVSFVTSFWTTRLELRKVPYEIQKMYAENLQKKRIEVYPEFYQAISILIKKIDRKTLDLDYMENWLNDYLLLDSKYSIFLSGNSSNSNYDLFTEMGLIIKDYQNPSKALDNKFYNRISKLNLGKVENNLKRDIGVYLVEFDPKIEKQIKSYNDIDRYQS